MLDELVVYRSFDLSVFLFPYLHTSSKAIYLLYGISRNREKNGPHLPYKRNQRG